MCDKFTLVVEVSPGLFRYTPMICRSRRCSCCAAKNAERLIEEFYDVSVKFKLNSFLTLISDLGHEIDPVLRLRRLRRCWSKFRIYCRRRFGQPLTFIGVLELSMNGMPHLHLLIDREIEQEWLAKVWAAVGGGQQVKIVPVFDRRGICQYLVKQLVELPEPSFHPRTKRITTSRDISSSKPLSRSPGHPLFRPYEEVKAEVKHHILEDRGDSFFLDWDIPK